MNKKDSQPQFVICLKNEDYPASLELRKIYQVIVDEKAAKHNLIRVIDESGEDYLYPVAYFASIKLPKEVKAALLSAA
jgi:hypothetical protein